MSRTVLNAVGVPLYYSGSSTAWFSATGSGTELQGTNGNDSLWGDTAVEVTMRGGMGDDIYYRYSSINRVYEAADQGVDTVNTWMSSTLREISKTWPSQAMGVTPLATMPITSLQVVPAVKPSMAARETTF